MFCLTGAMKQVGTGEESGDWIDKKGTESTEDDVWWGHWVAHWRDIGVWDYPSDDECDCDEHYSAEECYTPNDEDAFNDRAEVFGCPISEMTVGRPYEGTDSGGAVAWYGHGGVASLLWTSCYNRLIDAIWPSAEHEHWQIRLGALTWCYVMDYMYATSVEGEPTLWHDPPLENRLINQQVWIGDSALDIRTKYPSYLYITPDPTTIYQELAQPLNVGREFIVYMGEDAVFDTEKTYDPAPFALLTFAHGERAADGKNWDWEKYWVGMTDADGKVWMPGLTVVNPDLLRVVATRHNCRPGMCWVDLSP